MVSDLTDGSRTFYVKLTTDAWNSVSLYVWGNNASSGGWPGATMNQAYRCAVSTDAQKVIFNNTTTFTDGTYVHVQSSSGDSYAWRAIGALQSGTEQYYTIDYAACPTVAINGTTYYQVALHVRGGMASLSTVKTVGLTIAEYDLGDATVLRYTANGLLEGFDGEAAETTSVWNLYRISRQMRALEDLDAGDDGSGGNGESGGITGDDSNADTGDMSLVCITGVMIMALLCLVFVTSRKKVF